MLARKPEAVNDKLVTAKIFWTSFLQYEIVCFCVFFPAPMQCLYCYQCKQVWFLSKTQTFGRKSMFSKHFMIKVLLWVMKEQMYPPKRIFLICILKLLVSPFCLYFTISAFKNSWFNPSVLYYAKNFLIKIFTSAISPWTLWSCNGLT